MTSEQKQCVAVTGATGYLGVHLCQALAEAGYRTLALARPSSRLDRLRHMAPQAEIMLFDSFEQIPALLQTEAVDGLFHLACPNPSKEPNSIEDHIVSLAKTVTSALEKTSIAKVVSAGTWWQWNDLGQEHPLNAYASGKHQQHLIIDAAARNLGKLSLSLIPNDVYGPNDWRPKLMNLLLDSRDSPEPALLTGGDQKINLVHVTDAATAFKLGYELLGEAGSDIGTRFRVSGPDTLSIKSIVSLFERVGARPNVEFGKQAIAGRMNSDVPLPVLPGWHCSKHLEEFVRSELTKRAET